MGTATPTSDEQTQKVEDFYASAPAFAQPILQKLRETIAAADPALKPAWKWGTPVYEKAGAGMVCGVGAFKQHVNLVFMKGALLDDTQGLFTSSQDAKTMRRIKFTDASQIKTDLIIDYLRAAIQLNPKTAAIAPARTEIQVPEDLRLALCAAQLQEKFDALAYTHRKEYVRWVTEAKRPETRENRILKTVERISEGKKFS